MLRIAAYTLCALVAFALNSLLCRLALREGEIDAPSFTAVRLTAGAVVLLALARPTSLGAVRARGNWPSALALFVYAIAFSFSYLRLDAGTGALVLFGSVQITMIGAGVWRGERPGLLEWVGAAAALFGLGVLAAPGRVATSWLAVLLMIAAGAAWGIYSLRGRGSAAPLETTAGNFLRSVPMVAVVFALAAATVGLQAPSAKGLALAAASGGLASGLGYAIWYRALPHLSSSRAAIVQLAVPVLAASGGIAFLGERITARLAVSSLLILGGILVSISSRQR